MQTASDILAYRQLLSSHDWWFEYSDDSSAVRAGRHSLAIIRGALAKLDPSGEIWNEYAPEAFRIPVTPPLSTRTPHDHNPLPTDSSFGA